MVRVETDMSAQMGHVRFSPDSGNITDIAALRICAIFGRNGTTKKRYDSYYSLGR